MKHIAIFFGILTIFVGLANGQTLERRTTLSRSIDSTGRETATITYTGLENPDVKVFVAVVRASAGPCLGNYNVSDLRIADPAVAVLTYDPVNAVYKVRWTPTDPSEKCQVLFVKDGDRTVDLSDLATWRTNFGASGLVDDGVGKIVSADGADSGFNARTFTGTSSFKVVVDPQQ